MERHEEMQNNVLDYLDETVLKVPEKIAFSNGTDGMTFLQVDKAGLSGHGFIRAEFTGSQWWYL